MKKCIYVFCCLAILLISACEKKETYHFVIRGKVVHAYTGEPLAGIFVGASLKSWISASSGYLDKTYTDQNGNFILDIEYTKRGELDDIIILGANSPNEMDTTLNEFKYHMVEGPELSISEINDEQTILVYPSGSIKMAVSDFIWQQIQADTIGVQSPFETKNIIDGQSEENATYFSVTPSQDNTFSWYYIKDGIQSAPVTQTIFVPNTFTDYWGFYGPFTYEILF